MAKRNKSRFGLTIGRIGITVMTVGISILLLASFMFGVLVGRNIESYPEKIAKGIPSAIRGKMSEIGETPPEVTAKDDMALTFYQTLPRKGDDLSKVMPDDEIAGRPKPPRPQMPDEEAVVEPRAYTIQVAAFRDRAGAERLRDKLAEMGYASLIHKGDSAEQGVWYRLRIEGFDNRDEAQRESARIEDGIKGLKCLVLKN
jgi:cell division septation protein DedD